MQELQVTLGVTPRSRPFKIFPWRYLLVLLPLASGFSTVSLAVDIYYLGFEEVKTTCLAFLIVRIDGSAMERALTPIFSSRTLYAKTDLPAKGLVQKHHVQEEYNHGTNGCEDRGETSIHE